MTLLVEGAVFRRGRGGVAGCGKVCGWDIGLFTLTPQTNASPFANEGRQRCRAGALVCYTIRRPLCSAGLRQPRRSPPCAPLTSSSTVSHAVQVVCKAACLPIGRLARNPIQFIA